MKQTAIEWFAEKDTELTIQFLEGKLNQIQLAIEKTKCLQQAKEMERKQMMDSFILGGKSSHNISAGLNFKTFEEYYDETYGK